MKPSYPTGHFPTEEAKLPVHPRNYDPEYPEDQPDFQPDDWKSAVSEIMACICEHEYSPHCPSHGVQAHS